jgi:hypothetical protein
LVIKIGQRRLYYGLKGRFTFVDEVYVENGAKQGGSAIGVDLRVRG